MAILRLFSALRERRGVPNRKKVAKSSLFLFLRLADRRDGANPAKDESHTHRNQGMHLQSDKKPPEGGFVLKYMAGPAGFPRSASALPLGASACRQIPKNVPQARFLYGISPHRFEPFASGKATKNRPKAVSFSNIWLASRIRTYITGTKTRVLPLDDGPAYAIRRFVIITYLAWSSQTNSRFAKTPQPNMSAVMPRTGRGEPIALLAPKTPRHSQQQH